MFPVVIFKAPKEASDASGYLAASGSLNVGGKTVKEMMAAAKLGLRTATVCGPGEDEAGDVVVNALRRCGTVARFYKRNRR